jgi:hypothetical protein
MNRVVQNPVHFRAIPGQIPVNRPPPPTPILTVWPSLPDSIKAAILAMINAATGKGTSCSDTPSGSPLRNRQALLGLQVGLITEFVLRRQGRFSHTVQREEMAGDRMFSADECQQLPTAGKGLGPNMPSWILSGKLRWFLVPFQWRGQFLVNRPCQDSGHPHDNRGKLYKTSEGTHMARAGKIAKKPIEQYAHKEKSQSTTRRL